MEPGAGWLSLEQLGFNSRLGGGGDDAAAASGCKRMGERHKRRKAAGMIQARIRGKHAREARERRNKARAAAKIQARLRGKKARTERRQTSRAAVIVQSGCRGVLARSQARRKRGERDAATKLQALWRGKMARQDAWSAALEAASPAGRLPNLKQPSRYLQVEAHALLSSPPLPSFFPLSHLLFTLTSSHSRLSSLSSLLPSYSLTPAAEAAPPLCPVDASAPRRGEQEESGSSGNRRRGAQGSDGEAVLAAAFAPALAAVGR